MTDSAPANTSNPKLTPAQLRLLAEIGFTGVFYGLSSASKDIFDYIEQRTGHAEVGVLGNALALISDGEHNAAARLIEQGVLAKNPDSVDGQLFAALALKLSGQSSQAERLAARATAKGDNGVAASFAKNLDSISGGKLRPNY